MSASLATVLMEEVADLLRHDNMDSRILTWLRMAYNDMSSRMPVWRFFTMNQAGIGVTGAAAGTFTGNVDSTYEDYQDIITGLVSANSGVLYVPQYVPWGHFNRMSHSLAAGTPPQGTVPLFWTLGPDSRFQSATFASGRSKIYVWPSPPTGTTWTFTIIAKKLHYTSDVTTGRYPVPYHMEHALVWGAAYFGAKALRPQIAQIYLAEYEQAVQNLTWMLTYKPDATPSMRSTRGVYDGSSRLNTMPRIPSNIPAP